MNKTEIIRFRVSKEELKVINHRAAIAGLSREEYIRRALAGTAIVETPPADYRRILRKLDDIQDELTEVIEANPSIQNNVRLFVTMQEVTSTMTILMQVLRPYKSGKDAANYSIE